MNKITKFILLTSIFTINFSMPVLAKDIKNYNQVRIQGKDRYETSANIAEKFQEGKLDNVIITSGLNFPDALSGSALTRNLNAPILLVGENVSKSTSTINYIKNHLNKEGNIYVLGGKGAVGEDFEKYFKSIGYNNIKRLWGKDRFETNKNIVESLNVEKGTPVVIVNGYAFPDALSISSAASINGYPIVLSPQGKLTSQCKYILNNINPSKVYLIGGQGALSSNIEKEVKSITKSEIIRIQGKDRYETCLNINKYFKFESNNIIVANGQNFPDALSGTSIAYKLKAPIVLTDGCNVSRQKDFIDKSEINNQIILGGEASVSENASGILKQSANYEINTEGNSNGNINNFGMMAKQGNWIYYFNLEDNAKIYKMTTDGLYKIKITNSTGRCLNVIGDNIYYGTDEGIKILNINSGEEYFILKNKDVYSMKIQGDYIYYNAYFDGDFKIYKVGLNGQGDKLLGDSSLTKINVQGDWIYYIDNSQYGISYLYKLKTDGSEKVLLNKESSIIASEVYGDYVYYCNDSHIYKMKTDGSEKVKICDDRLYKCFGDTSGASNFNIKDGYIYYTTFKNHGEDKQLTLYKLSLDGKQKIELCSGVIDSINIIDDYLYIDDYIIKDFPYYEGFYKVNINNGNKTKF
jgi:putative cell wall-binding protein